MQQGVKLSQQPWWTTADAAELDLLTHELVKAGWIHKTRCPDCADRRTRNEGWCARMDDAYNAVDEWRTGRILRSKAMHARLQQSLTEWAAAA